MMDSPVMSMRSGVLLRARGALPHRGLFAGHESEKTKQQRQIHRQEIVWHAKQTAVNVAQFHAIADGRKRRHHESQHRARTVKASLNIGKTAVRGETRGAHKRQRQRERHKPTKNFMRPVAEANSAGQGAEQSRGETKGMKISRADANAPLELVANTGGGFLK